MLFTGRITADAAVREIGGNKKVTGFTIAINDRFTSKGEMKQVTTFVECSYWINPGLAVYLNKGSVVEIFGRMEAKAWLNSENKPQPYLTCTVTDIRLFGTPQSMDSKKGRDKSAKADNETKSEAAGNRNGSGDDDDLPF